MHLTSFLEILENSGILEIVSREKAPGPFHNDHLFPLLRVARLQNEIEVFTFKTKRRTKSNTKPPRARRSLLFQFEKYLGGTFLSIFQGRLKYNLKLLFTMRCCCPCRAKVLIHDESLQGRYLEHPPELWQCPPSAQVFWQAWPRYGITRGPILSVHTGVCSTHAVSARKQIHKDKVFVRAAPLQNETAPKSQGMKIRKMPRKLLTLLQPSKKFSLAPLTNVSRPIANTNKNLLLRLESAGSHANFKGAGCSWDIRDPGAGIFKMPILGCPAQKLHARHLFHCWFRQGMAGMSRDSVSEGRRKNP